jgi:cytochrome c-type biogenesis protein CcmH/NrfG
MVKLFRCGLWLLFLNTVAVVGQVKKAPEAKDNVVTEFLASYDSLQQNKAILEGPPQLELPVVVATGNAHQDSIRFERQLKKYDFDMMHQQRSFAWQFYSGIIIFMLVIFIVLMGLLLSYKQFQLTELQIKANIVKPKAEMAEVNTENTNIEISQSGLKINTGVIGLAILFLSLAFFFLYLKYVYQIEVIDVVE